MANVKKMDVPDIGGLLGQIAEKRHDLPKTPIQSVNPVGEKPVERKTVEPAKRQNKKADCLLYTSFLQLCLCNDFCNTLT